MSQIHHLRWIDADGKLHDKRLPFDAEEAEIFRQDFSAQLNPTVKAAAFLSETALKTPKKLCVFDMDSTLINQEVIDEIARLYGFYEKVAEITEAAMQGKLDFAQALRERCKLFTGMPASRLNEILKTLTLSPGAELLLQFLQSQGTKTAIVSGGFEFVLKHFQGSLKIDQVHAHTLDLDPTQSFTGTVLEPIIDAEQKRKLVAEMKSQYGATAEETITVGDGANDIEMMKEASIKVSFHGKPKLNAAANVWLLERDFHWLKVLLS